MVKQGLKEVVVAPVDDRDVDGFAGKPLCRGKPTKTRADDHDALALRRCGHEA